MTTAPATSNLATTSVSFLAYLDEWYASLPSLSLAEVIGGNPENVALFSTDMINGFCKHGPLASERVGALTTLVADIFQRAYVMGIRQMLAAQDTHDPNTEEFQTYPPHCVRGTDESETVDELKQLPFFEHITIIEKNALSPFFGTNLEAWVTERLAIETYIVVGNCSDLCVYSMAMELRMHANALNLHRRVIVPANAVDTFDTPLETARQLGIKAHDADLHHVLFLHHMAMNGVEVVRDLV
ncbi:MAG: cysteine hydrolase [Chloroflexaceae bacterium]|nr:cysteine hydrolase [Chloroflexaceae bacterium]